eukprot:TRINITY_DN359_c1_g1_i4.p1 TRINITY_DN359_c1_g1~~TRINITY_DN359_c1_g1_i4.p1  ORF type:complete len:627 (+),score=167.74 TRINITY_DN359_c1_g1_i4:262-1881(+)
MAYGTLAGVPPIYGLYNSILPPFIYAVFGSSMQLSLGPVAVTAILTKSAVETLNPTDEEQTILYSSVLGFWSGIILIFMGIFNVGFVVSFLSNTVLSGFMSAAAFIIVASQFKDLFGITGTSSGQGFVSVIYDLFANLETFSWQTFLCSIAVIAIIFGFKKIPRVPSWIPIELFMMLLGILVGYLEPFSIVTIGHVPRGLPRPYFPPLIDLPMRTVLTQSTVIAIVSYIGSIALAKNFATKNGYAINPTQEFIAQGLTGVGTAFFRGHPVSGSFSRTAVNNQMGAKTPISGMITGTLIIIFLLLLTGIFQFLPKFVLACIVILSVRSLIDYQEAIYLWKNQREELAVFLITFLLTLFAGVDLGVFLSIAVSIVFIIFQSSRPSMVELGLCKSGVFRNLDRYPNAKTWPGIFILRIEADLFFANVDRFKERIYEHAQIPGVKAIIIDGSSFNRIDASALHVLSSIATDLKNKNIIFALSRVRGPVRDALRVSGISKLVYGDPRDSILEILDLIFHENSVNSPHEASSEVQVEVHDERQSS